MSDYILIAVNYARSLFLLYHINLNISNIPIENNDIFRFFTLGMWKWVERKMIEIKFWGPLMKFILCIGLIFSIMSRF
jgi:hypothetical protein